MDELIEEFLRARGVRFFRGHHDDEYFFRIGRLYVHLEVCGADRDAVQIGFTADRYYPVGQRVLLEQVIAGWNSECRVIGATVHDSSDPGLVGVSAGSRHRGTDVDDLAAFIEGAVAAAIDLFGRIRRPVAPVTQTLRDVS